MKIYDTFNTSAYAESINKKLLFEIIVEKERRKAEIIAKLSLRNYREFTGQNEVLMAKDIKTYAA